MDPSQKSEEKEEEKGEKREEKKGEKEEKKEELKRSRSKEEEEKERKEKKERDRKMKYLYSFNAGPLMTPEDTRKGIAGFDVDKFYGGVYVMMQNYKFYRFECLRREGDEKENESEENEETKKGESEEAKDGGIEGRGLEMRNNDRYLGVAPFTSVLVGARMGLGRVEVKDAKLPGLESDGSMRNEVTNKEYKKYRWIKTHEVSLRHMKGGIPLGYCTVRYDSVKSRILIADSYKLRAIYI